MRFDAWGGPCGQGPYSEFCGYDDNIQAGIGIMSRFGGGLKESEEHAHIGTIDVIAGVAAAFSLLLALVYRKKKGRTVTARTSLASAGQYLQYCFMFGHTPPQLRRSQAATTDSKFFCGPLGYGDLNSDGF